MTDKLKILEFFLNLNSEQLTVKNSDLMKKFNLTASAASHRLSRLCNQGLIKSFSIRKKKCYVLTTRGIEKLKWLREKENETGEKNKPRKTFIEKLEDFLLADEDEDDDFFG